MAEKTIGERLDERDARLLREYLDQSWFDDEEVEDDILVDSGCNRGDSDSLVG